MKPLFNDILPIREYLYNSNLYENVTALGEYCLTRESFNKKNLNQQKVSLQSHFCTTEESKCLEILREVCINRGLLDRKAKLSKESRNLSFIPFFDGAYVSFPFLLRKEQVQYILTDTNDLIAPYIFELKEIQPEWDFIHENDLNIYEKIHNYLRLSPSDIPKMLEFLNIAPFSLDESQLKSILSLGEKEVIKLLQEGENMEFNQFVQQSAKLFHYKVRRALAQLYKENTIDNISRVILENRNLRRKGFSDYLKNLDIDETNETHSTE